MHVHADTTPEDVYDYFLAALRSWHSSAPENLLDFLLMVREREAGQRDTEPRGPSSRSGDPLVLRRRITNEVLLLGLEALQQRAPEDAEVLRARFIQKKSLRQVAFSVNLTPDQISRRQKKAILMLSELLLEQELQLRQARAGELETRLPARQYSHLFGIRPALDELTPLLIPSGPPWVVTLSGMGGIGKSALAHFLALQAVPDYSAATIQWVYTPSPVGAAAEPAAIYDSILSDLADELVPPGGPPDARREQVKRVLKSGSHLVVIDNLESESDTIYVLENLHGIAAPTKFLLTTRADPSGPAGVYTYRVRELDYADAAALVREFSRETGQRELAIEQEEDLQAIYRTVGGNPLALKLVAGMTARFPLPKVLSDLGERNLSQTVAMYDRIFQRAWDALNPDARELLEGMPLVSEAGGSPEQLLAFSGLPVGRFWVALNELLSRSLLETRGTASERRYGIHQLTRTFLETQIIDA